MSLVYGSLTDMVIKTSLGKMATLKYTAAPQSLTFSDSYWPRVDSSTTDRNYGYRTGNFPPTTGNANFLITNGSGIIQNIWNITERNQYKEVLKYNDMSIRIMIDSDNVGCDISFYNTNTNGEFMHYRISYAAIQGYTAYNAAAIVFFTVEMNGNTYYMPAIISTTSDYFYIEGVTYYMQHYSAPIEAPTYNWIPVNHLSGNSGQFSMDLSTIDASIIGDGETQTGSNDTTKIKIFEVSNFQNIVANFLDDQETIIAYCGGNYMTATCQRIEESPTAIFRKIRLKLYYQADNTLIYTSPYFNIRIGGLQTYYLSMIKDDNHYMAAFDLIDVPQSGEYQFVYNKWTLPSEVEMSQIYQWLLANEAETEGPYDTGSEDSGGDPSTPRAQDHIGDSPVPTTGGLNIGFVTLYKPSSQDLVNIAGFLWSDNVLANFKKYFNNFADNLLALFSLPYDAPNLDTKAFTVGNITSETITAVPFVSNRYVDIPMGEVEIRKLWESYLDFGPYTKCQIYLPYVGIHSLDIDELMCPAKDTGVLPSTLGSFLSLVYRLDMMSGIIVAKIFVSSKDSNGVQNEVRYQFTGKCGHEIPITGATYASMMQSYITAGAGLATSLASGGLTAPMTIGAAVTANVQAQKSEVIRIGNFTGNASDMATKVPYIILSTPNKPKLDGQEEFTGFPSYRSGTLSQFGGYTEVLDVHLDQSSATEQEKQMIIDLLKGGVILD